MKVVFIQPKSFFTWEALGIGYLAGYLKKHIPGVDIGFYSEFHDTEYTILEGCKDADIIGIGATSPQYARACAWARRLKTSKNRIVIGGYHVTNCQKIPDGVDGIVVGEGELGMLRFCNGEDGIIISEPIPDINDLPYPDREAIKINRQITYCKEHFGARKVTMLANRGCPYRCTFCASRSMWGGHVRSRSAESIYAEFDMICKDYSPDFITFSDDELGVNKKQLNDFCELKIKAQNAIPWGCNFVAKDLSLDMAKAMRAAGCAEVWMGLESGAPEILAEMGKAGEPEDVIRAFRYARSAGLLARAYCLLGMPGETYATIRQTEKLIDFVVPDIVSFSILAPYPGTSFYNDSLKNTDWSTVDEYTNDITRTNTMTNQELKSEQARLVEKYKSLVAYRNTK